MGSRFFSELSCTICKKPVDLISDLFADENGKAVHEDCYVKLIAGSSSNPAAAVISTSH